MVQGAAKAGNGKLVGTVSHRPFPGLPDEVGMVRETRALPGRCSAVPFLPIASSWPEPFLGRRLILPIAVGAG